MAVGKTFKAADDQPTPFRVCRLEDAKAAGQADIVQGLVGGGTVIAAVGTPGAGKTALAIDLSLHIAAGESWFNLKVAGGPVVYFAPEAPASVLARANAARTHKFEGRSLRFYLCQETPELGGDRTSVIDAERTVATVRAVASAEGELVKLAVVDTLASCMGNGDENSDGMIRLVAAAKYVATTAECAVMLVHHPSKGDSAGLRGHGSLAAACDTILTISVDEVSGIRKATLIKSRDSATGLQLCYTLEPVTLPEPDSFGDPRTTVIIRSQRVSASKPRPTGARQQALLAELERRHRSGEHGWSEAVVREAGRTIGIKAQSARDALKGLMNAGYLWGQPAHLVLKYPPDEDTK
jgi:KaiC/GvpD/RAD55 family RecA-like ATPase